MLQFIGAPENLLVLPASAVDSINRYGYLRQRDLVLPWLDRQHRWLGQI